MTMFDERDRQAQQSAQVNARLNANPYAGGTLGMRCMRTGCQNVGFRVLNGICAECRSGDEEMLSKQKAFVPQPDAAAEKTVEALRLAQTDLHKRLASLKQDLVENERAFKSKYNECESLRGQNARLRQVCRDLLEEPEDEQ